MSSTPSGALQAVSPPTSFVECWDRQAHKSGERLALSDSRHSLTWRAAAELSRLLARGLLSLGLHPGAVVACWLPNWVELYVLRIACERAGLIWLPIPANLREREIRLVLDQARPTALVVPERFRDRDYAAVARSLLRKKGPAPPRLIVVPSQPGSGDAMTLDEVAHRGGLPSAPTPASPSGEPLVILPTSGSSGVPKFAQFRVSAWLLRGRTQAQLFDLREDDVIVSLTQGIGPSIIPLFAAPVVGAAVHLVDQFHPEDVMRTLGLIRPTLVCAVPAQLTTLIHQSAWPPPGLQRLRIWYSTGADRPRATAERLEATTPGIALSGYGGVDFGGWAVPSPSDPPEIRYETVGQPRAGAELRVVDESGRDVPDGDVGEIWGRGPCCADGYFRDEVATRERWTPDGWFRTSDLGHWDSAGDLVIVGRTGEVIRRGGRSIHPEEIEGLLSAYPRILKVAVVAMPDPVLGERVCACVVPTPGQPLSLEDVTGYLRSRQIASFKLPERLELFSDLPLTGDKIDRAALRLLIRDRIQDGS